MRAEFQRIAPYVAITLAVFLAYGAVLWNGAGFSHPDDLTASRTACCEFRPLTSATYALNQWAGGGWMALNFLLHFSAACLLFLVSRSLMASLLFSVHPMATDAVASVAGRSALIAAVLILGMLALKSRWKWALGGFSVLAIGLSPRILLAIPHAPARLSFSADYLLSLPHILLRMVVPTGLSADPDYGKSFAVAPLLLCFFALGYLFEKTRKPLALLLIPLAVYACFPVADVFLEHRGYLAIAGASWLVALLPRWIPLTVLPMFMLVSQARAEVYRSPMVLWNDAAMKTETKARPHHNYALQLALVGRTDSAMREYRRAIAIDPSLESSYNDLAVLYLSEKNISMASKVLDQWSAYRDHHKGD